MSFAVRPGVETSAHTVDRLRRLVCPGPLCVSASTASAYVSGLYSMASWVKFPPAGWPGQMVWIWLLVTPTPRASSRYADAPVPSWGWTTWSALL